MSDGRQVEKNEHSFCFSDRSPPCELYDRQLHQKSEVVLISVLLERHIQALGSATSFLKNHYSFSNRKPIHGC